jgi:hypothetical protein
MKTKLLFLSMLLAVCTLQAQFTVEDGSGNPIMDGDSFDYNTLSFPEAELKFFINNPSTTDDLYMRVEYVSVTGNTGDEMEICIGNCYNGTMPGMSYPTSGDGLYITIAPGDQSLDGNHFLNTDPGNGSDAVVYNFRFYQVLSDGTETGDELSITYTYDPNLSVDETNKLEASVYPTVTRNSVTVRLIEDANLAVYDLRGRLVMNRALEAGETIVDVSNLASQAYIIQFTNNRGLQQTTKIVKN